MNQSQLLLTRRPWPGGGDGTVVLALAGRLDAASQGQAEAALLGQLGPGPGGPRRLVLECSGLDFVSSAGLRVLVAVVRRLKPAGGELVLCAPRPAVRHLIELSGMVNLLRMADNLETARADLG